MALIKTDEGQLAFKQRSPFLSARQRSAFIMFDGVKSVEQVVKNTAGLGVTQVDVDQMLAHGFLKEGSASGVPVAAPSPSPTHSESPASTPASAPPVAVPAAASRSKQERYSQGWPMATQLTASLGLRGFRLNLAVEAASGFDDLLTLFPKIQAAVGVEKCAGLERVLTA